MTIHELLALTGLTESDEIPVWDAEASSEPTKKITAQNMTASVKALGSLVNTSEMNNALAGKQNTLTFDATPTTGSTNPVTSDGVADAIQQSAANIPRIKTTAVTGTTNGTGNLLYNTFTGTKIIGAESNNSIVLYFLSGDYYYFKVLSWDDMSPKTNVPVTINVVYY